MGVPTIAEVRPPRAGEEEHRTFEEYCWQLRRAVSRSGLSRAELAERLGLTPATIKSWVVGRRSPTVRRLLQLAAALEVDVQELFTEPVDMPAAVSCAACGQPFRRDVGYRIHVALRARTCDEHARLADATGLSAG